MFINQNLLSFEKIQKLCSFYKLNGKIGGELFEIALKNALIKNGFNAVKNSKRGKEDLIINEVKVSVKSTTTNAIQVDTMSDSGITIEYLLSLDGKDKNFSSNFNINNKEEIINKICDRLDKMPIIFGCFNFYKDKCNFTLFELSYEQLCQKLKNVNKIVYRKPLTKSRLEFYIDNKLIFEIKDGTGKKEANAFQRGLWIDDINSFINNIDKYVYSNIIYSDIEKEF